MKNLLSSFHRISAPSNIINDRKDWVSNGARQRYVAYTVHPACIKCIQREEKWKIRAMNRKNWWRNSRKLFHPRDERLRFGIVEGNSREKRDLARSCIISKLQHVFRCETPNCFGLYNHCTEYRIAMATDSTRTPRQTAKRFRGRERETVLDELSESEAKTIFLLVKFGVGGDWKLIFRHPTSIARE